MSIVNNSILNQRKSYFSLAYWLVPVIISLVLISISTVNFLFFHVLAEFFAITIAILASVVAWNMYPFTRNNYLMYLGCGYFWIGLLDLLHTVSYKGMSIIPDAGSNMATQFWIGTRYLEAILLLTAPWFLNHRFKRSYFFSAFGVAALIITSLIVLGFFPEGFIEGKGLTDFKVYSEYLIIFMLAISIRYIYVKREFLDHRIVNILIISVVFTMFAELAFTFYVSLYGLSNIAGHIFKIFSFWLIFQAVIKTTLEEPFLAISRSATTYDAVPDATIVVDKKGIIHEANKAALSLSGLSNKNLIGKSNHDIFHAKSINTENCEICQAIINNASLRSLEVEIDNKGTFYDFSLSRITGASGLEGTVEVVRDITERKNVEDAINELDILKNSIIENLPSMVFVKDARDKFEHSYVEWNKAAEEITGLLKKDIVGKNDFDLWPKEEAKFFINKDNEVMSGGESIEIKQEPLTTSHKGVRTLHTKKVPIFDKSGNAKYLLGISEDITDQLKTEEMLRRSQKMDAVGQMSGGIAHDFNNQLGVVLGYTDLLLEQDIPEAQVSWLNSVRVAAERCSELTQQLLIFSRSGNVDKETIDVNTTISEIEVMIQRTITPEVKVQYFLSKNLWNTEVNIGGFKDAILNLILNARDAMPNGGTLTIETTNIILNKSNIGSFSNIKEGEYVEVVINDSGEGMSQDVYEHVFEPFFTTKDVGQGTGLGLSMVYGFVRRYGGDILLTTKQGKGSTFRIYLPRSSELEPLLSDSSSTKEKVFPIGTEKILIVDDEISLLKFAEQLLKSWGYNVFCAENATEALDVLKNKQVDLLFTDIVMPGDLNGYELSTKALEINPKIKILTTSGYAGKSGDNTKYDFEMIAKPYKSLDLAEKLRQQLDAKS